MYEENGFMFGNTKLNLEPMSKVVLGRTSDPDLDGREATVLGKPNEDVTDAYIVMFAEPYNNQMAIVIPEGCISPVDEWPSFVKNEKEERQAWYRMEILNLRHDLRRNRNVLKLTELRIVDNIANIAELKRQAYAEGYDI